MGCWIGNCFLHFNCHCHGGNDIAVGYPMKTYLIKNEAELVDWFTKLHTMGDGFYPITLQVYKGDKKHRSLAANALSQVWYREIAKQSEDRTVQEVRRECKLNIGVPILRGSSEKFRAMYDNVVSGHDYETQLEMMDYLPVTSTMTVTQMSEYMESLYFTYSQAGFYLEANEQ